METELTYADVLALLEDISSPNKAEKSPIAAFCQVERYEAFFSTTYLAMRRVIQDGIDVLSQEQEQLAQIITLRFIDEKKVLQIAREKNFSERKVENLQQEAIKRLTRILNKLEERCQEGQPGSCGDQGINLSYRLPMISSAFGSYFTGLLAESNNYCNLDQQIECPSTAETKGLPSLSRIQYLLRKPKGPQILFVGGASGIGKTTLATKILKCLFEEHDADRILGGSAKTEYVDVITQEVRSVEADFRDSMSFYRRLYRQLGLPRTNETGSTKQLANLIRQWLRDQRLRTVIALDNLDDLDSNAIQHLMHMLLPLLNRDCRAIITTRYLSAVPQNAFTVKLRPLTDSFQVSRFLQWHLDRYSAQQTGLTTLEFQPDKIKALVEKSQGVPLLIQLLLSSVVLFGWSYLERNMPLGTELYNFLYRQHWDALANAGQTGQAAQKLAIFIVDRQRRGKQTTNVDIEEWSKIENTPHILDIMRMLSERFLVINHNSLNGDFATFPSFMDFVHLQT